MRIAVISTPVFPCPPPGYSGLEQLAWQQASGLGAKGHEVTLFAPDGSTCPNAKVFEFGPAGNWDERRAFKGYWEQLRHFDVIIDNTWLKYCYKLKMEGVLKAPVLGVMHAPCNTMYQGLPPGVEKPCFVCISRDQAAHFQALYGREARVCHNGLDLNFYASLGIPRSDRFLFLARFSQIKGADIAIQACKQAGVGLDLVGDTSITNEPDYLKRCQDMADGKQIRIVGPASRSECVWWFSQAHCLLHPNKFYREPFGLAPVEAQACGCPVIAWRYGALQETVEHGKTGFLVSTFEELVYCINLVANQGVNPETRSYMRNWATQFSIDKMVSRYEELCNEALQGGW